MFLDRTKSGMCYVLLVCPQIHVHPVGSDSLYQYVPREILPEEYGGSAGPVKEIKGDLYTILTATIQNYFQSIAFKFLIKKP